MKEAQGRGIHLALAGETHVGRVRKENQDLYFAGVFPDPAAAGQTPPVIGPGTPRPPGGGDPGALLGPRGALAAVADGMGGPGGGGRASHLALETLVASLEEGWATSTAPATPGAFSRALEEAVRAANRAVHAEAGRAPEYAGMGTTLTLVGFLGDTAYLVQVGDSRAYLLRGETLLQLTRDQSLVQEMVDRGVLTPESAALSAQRNVILQALGPDTGLTLFTDFLTLRQGDLLLLCSDGLSGYAPHAVLEGIVRGNGSLAHRAERLVQAALEGGGEDNVTAVLVQVTGEGLRPSGAEGPSLPRRLPPDAP